MCTGEREDDPDDVGDADLSCLGLAEIVLLFEVAQSSREHLSDEAALSLARGYFDWSLTAGDQAPCAVLVVCRLAYSLS